MRRSFILAAAALIPVLAGACAEKQSGGETTPSTASDDDRGDAITIEDMRERALAEIDAEACAAGGGDVRQEGMLGLPRCVTPFADAGKVCRDRDDCLGRCLGDEATTDYNAPAGQMTGVCEANDSPFGCYAEIESGASTGMICVD